MQLGLFAVKSAIIINDNLYCVPNRLNDLYKISMSDWSMEKICELPFQGRALPVDIFLVQKSIWCVSMNGVQIIQYDIVSGQSRYYETGEVDNGSTDRENLCAICFNEMLWLVPRDLPGKLYAFSLEEKTFLNRKCWQENWNNEKIVGRIITYSYQEGCLTMVPRYTKKILQYNFCENTMLQEELNVADDLLCVVPLQDHYYITTENTKDVLYWSGHGSDIEKMEGILSKKRNYVRAMVLEDTILLSDGVRLDIFDGEHVKPFVTDAIATMEPNGSLFITYVKYKNAFLLLPWNAKSLLEVEDDWKTVKKHILQLPMDDVFTKTSLLREEEVPLEDYLTGIQRRKTPARKHEHQKDTAGSHILQIMKKE